MKIISVKLGILFILFLLLGSIFGCDILYYPKLCNGYSIPIVVTLSTEDKKIENIKLPSLTQSEVVKRERFIQITISSINNKVLAIYSINKMQDKVIANYSKDKPQGRKLLSSLGSNPLWLITRKGLFLVPKKFAENWEKHISDIEKESGISFPNIELDE